MRLRASVAALAVLASIACCASAAAASTPERLTPRIVGGRSAANGAWPTAVFVLAAKDVDHDGHLDPYFGCTGSVVAPTWIVTAGHCVLDPETGNTVPAILAVMGVSDINDPAAEVIPASVLIPHPAYSLRGFSNDIALIGLSRPTHSPPIRLASTSELQAGAYASPANVINAAGWGKTDEQNTQSTSVLQEAYLGIQDDAVCTQLITAFDPNTMTCAGLPQTSGVCHGDSGGPLVVFDAHTGERVLWGLTSYGTPDVFGLPPCSLQVPAAFTWVPAFRSFIDSHIGSPAPGSTPPPPPPVAAPPPAVTAVVADRTRPVLRAIALSRQRFTAARHGSMLAAATGATLFYRLSEPATVSATVQRRVRRHGRVRWGSLTPRGSLRGTAGANVATFSGRLGGHRLAGGHYRLRLQATDSAGNRSLAKTVTFTITG